MINSVTLAEGAGFGHAFLAIEPLALGPSDGKGLLVNDSIGQSFFFSIGDDFPIQIWDGVVQDYEDAVIEVGREYEFLVYMRPQGVEVYRVDERRVESILEYPIVMVPPLKYELRVQRTGAVFRDVVLRENKEQP